MHRDPSLPVLTAAVLAVLLVLTPTRASEPTGWPDFAVRLLNETSWREAETLAKDWLREAIVSEEDLRTYGLKLDDRWQQADPRLPMVIVVHGFNATPDSTMGLLKSVRSAGYPCGTFAYPNDHKLHDSGRLLARELRRFGRLYPNRRVTLLCHSMGGLVAREAVENPRLDPGNVDRLILIAPPNGGSMLALLGTGADAWEHWLARGGGWPWQRFSDSVIDGLGEAVVDLQPGSRFLTELNARPRNRDVQYTVVLGTAGVLTEQERQRLRSSLRRALGHVPAADEYARRLDALVADLDELVAGKGDCVVAVSRGRLDGVDDTVILPFDHLSVTHRTGTRVEQAVRRVIFDRLK